MNVLNYWDFKVGTYSHVHTGTQAIAASQVMTVQGNVQKAPYKEITHLISLINNTAYFLQHHSPTQQNILLSTHQMFFCVRDEKENCSINQLNLIQVISARKMGFSVGYICFQYHNLPVSLFLSECEYCVKHWISILE